MWTKVPNMPFGPSGVRVCRRTCKVQCQSMLQGSWCATKDCLTGEEQAWRQTHLNYSVHISNHSSSDCPLLLRWKISAYSNLRDASPQQQSSSLILRTRTDSGCVAFAGSQDLFSYLYHQILTYLYDHPAVSALDEVDFDRWDAVTVGVLIGFRIVFLVMPLDGTWISVEMVGVGAILLSKLEITPYEFLIDRRNT